ncbi:hypothetical protein A3Q56_08485 [Intoshia linei]|uniref:Uncharacterized protein n=1 Tax=Intoshia linei TaxID=1819745 RepID=A0A177APR2_9BILA|nr:hypothetical protein A3Q56_08485 [Intoshia linei]
MQLVKLQVDEMNRLKEEILVLSQKGGHVLPPVNSKMPMKPNNSRIYTDETSFHRMDTEFQ